VIEATLRINAIRKQKVTNNKGPLNKKQKQQTKMQE
jgi:hypothetical protein